MKTFKLFLFLIIGLSAALSSCKKTEEEVADEIIDDILNIKGNINLKVDGVTYNKLFSSVVYSESDKMVSFWAYDLDSNEDSFILSFGEVPEVGETGTIDPGSENSMTLMIIGSFNEEGSYAAQSGTIKRLSTDKYELNVVINNLSHQLEPLSLTGTVEVGEHN